MQACSKGKGKNAGAVVWRTTCSRCHKDKDGGTGGARGQYSRPVVHQPREGDAASNQSDVVWDDADDWQRFPDELDYGGYVGADRDAERDEEQWTGQCEQQVEAIFHVVWFLDLALGAGWRARILTRIVKRTILNAGMVRVPVLMRVSRGSARPSLPADRSPRRSVCSLFSASCSTGRLAE